MIHPYLEYVEEMLSDATKEQETLKERLQKLEKTIAHIKRWVDIQRTLDKGGD